MICVCLIVVYESLSNAFLKSVYIRSILSSRITPLAAEFDSRTSFREPKLFICKQIICDKMFHTHRCAAPTTEGAKIAFVAHDSAKWILPAFNDCATDWILRDRVCIIDNPQTGSVQFKCSVTNDN